MSDQDRINSDDIPSASHQAEIHRMANEYLACFADLGEKKQDLDRIDGQFKRDPLLGLEVLDEVLVLYKNDPQILPNQPEMAAMIIGKRWKDYYDKVVQLRGGRARTTTTPTLRGGGKR